VSSYDNWEVNRLRRRLYSRTPLIGSWQRRQAARTLAADDSTAAVRVLAEALTKSDDENVRAIALESLQQLDDWRAISAVCEVWAETRHPRLTTLLLKKEWIASIPPRVKVLSALKQGQLDALTGGGVRTVEALVAACEDPDPIIAQRALEALSSLKHKGREVLCRMLIEDNDPIAQRVTLEAGYFPKDEQQRALFFFLTEQWERYDGLDFDRRLLRTAYVAAGDALRRRIREKLRTAGRTDFLTVIAGRDQQTRAAEMVPREIDLLIQTLIANEEWPRLWDLAPEVSLSRSVRIVERLANAGWVPEGEESGAIFRSLAALTAREDGLPTGDTELRQLFPPALRKAQARVTGRINDLAFSPLRPVIAIGTGERRVAVWNYRQGEREQLLKIAEHSVGNVTFTGDGTLLWAERTNRTDVPCAVYLWREDRDDRSPSLLGRHTGSVTAIAPVGERQLLTAGRDRWLILWDVYLKRELASVRWHDWARAMQVSPDEEQVALLRDGLVLAALPQLDQWLHGGGRSVGRCAAFLPPGYAEGNWKGSGPAPENQTLLVGQYNGDVAVYYPRNDYWITFERQPFTRHAGRVEGVNLLHGRSVVVTAGSEGTIRFTDLDDRSIIGEVKDPLGQVTSLHVSPDECFMAVGNSEASFSLWDLRGLDVLDLLLDPLGRAPASALTTLRVVAGEAYFSPRALRTLEFAERMLRHRVRFDIELGPAPTLVAGEFDIEIE
jgi:hypothetical protein